MSERTNRIVIGKLLRAAAGSLSANLPVMIAVVLAVALIGGLTDTASRQAGNLVGSITTFFVGLFATHKALIARYGDDPDIQPHGTRVFGLNLLSGIAIIAGLLLLVVPGLMLLARWAVAIPSMMKEDLDMRGALRRSARLTQGSRWAIFWLGVIVWGSAVLILMVFVIARTLAGNADMEGLSSNIVINLVFACATALSATIWAESYGVLAQGGTQTDGSPEVDGGS